MHLVSLRTGYVYGCKSPEFVTTRYSENLLAGARGFFSSSLEGFSMLKSRVPYRDLPFVHRLYCLSLITLPMNSMTFTNQS